MNVTVTRGELLEQDVEVIVHPWNHNAVPWRWRAPQPDLSRALRRRAGPKAFRALARHGWIALGGAVLTGAGRLPFRGIVHVASVNLLGWPSERAIRNGVRSVVQVLREQGFASAAFPVLGACSKRLAPGRALAILRDALGFVPAPPAAREVRIVVAPGSGGAP